MNLVVYFYFNWKKNVEQEAMKAQGQILFEENSLRTQNNNFHEMANVYGDAMSNCLLPAYSQILSQATVAAIIVPGAASLLRSLAYYLL